MALFDIFKKRKEQERFQKRQKKPAVVLHDVPQETKDVTGKKTAGVSVSAANVLIQPLMTEKSVASHARGVYSFKVHSRATKTMIIRAVEELYRVSVRGVRVMNVAHKWRFVRGRAGVRPGFRKALVSLHEGHKIET